MGIVKRTSFTSARRAATFRSLPHHFGSLTATLSINGYNFTLVSFDDEVGAPNTGMSIVG
jgi:hypothetical protein